MNTKRFAILIFVLAAFLAMLPSTNAGFVTSVPIRSATFLTGCWVTPESRCQPNAERTGASAGLWHVRDGYSVGFSIPFVSGQRHIAYELTYLSQHTQKGIAGSHDYLATETEFVRSPIVLGSCSSGGTCTIDPEISDIHLRAVITDILGIHHIFEASL